MNHVLWLQRPLIGAVEQTAGLLEPVTGHINSEEVIDGLDSKSARRSGVP